MEADSWWDLDFRYRKNAEQDVAPREDFDDNELNFRDHSGKIRGVREKWEKRKKERTYRALS